MNRYRLRLRYYAVYWRTRIQIRVGLIRRDLARWWNERKVKQ